MKRILLVAGAAGAGVAAYLLLRPSDAVRPRDPEPVAVATPDAAATRDAGIPFIRRLGSDGGAGAGAVASGGSGGGAGAGATEPERPPSVTFEREERDVGWASEQEKEMTLRMRRIVDALALRDTPIDIDAIECRHAQCRVAVHARDEAALGRFYAQLESPEGLYGWADNLLLAPVVTAPDGQVTTNFIASYERE
ncbi:MAG TPA: hypothetical protein VM261_28325 [Kofleriaceae bacterium]|nr:hypothetical protein [Kofleriaceae bacterium]